MSKLGRMGIIKITLCFLLAFSNYIDPVEVAAQPPDLEKLIAKMSTAEKLGQLSQYAGGRSKNLNSKLTDAELDRVRTGGVGSYLHVAGAAPLAELQRVAIEDSPHGIPLLFAMDVVHGYRTIFPVPLAIASSWDPDTARTMARISGIEASAAGLHWTFAPMIDIARDPRWGRIVEGAGTDPYLGSSMAIAQIDGYQGQTLAQADTILATAKHLGAYGAGIGGRDYESADISNRTLNEVYLPPFYAAAKAGVGSFMTAFNDIAGAPTTSNEALLRGQVREQWGWNGVILSDWNAIEELINHGVAETREDAGRLALKAGVDMEMVSGIYGNDLVGKIDNDPELMTALDEAVRRILKVKIDLGLFDNPYQYHDVNREKAVILSDEHRQAARQAASKSIVLLKNDDTLLPLSPDINKIAVIGALADDDLSQLGSWRAQGKAEDVVTLLSALQDRLPDTKITFSPGTGKTGIQQAVRSAKRADLIILVAGEDYDLSGEARSRSDIGLPNSQAKLVSEITKLNRPFVTILMNGRPMAIPKLAAQSPALLETWFLGVEAGNAIVDVLLGEMNPGGKLPAAFPRVTGQSPIYYSHRNTGRPANPDLSKDTTRYHDLPITPLFPFGHGLSYTSFAYSDLTLSSNEIGENEQISIAVTITNDGQVTGDEVVQLYIRDPIARIAQPIKQLRGFKRLTLTPGTSKRVEFTLTPAQFAYYGNDGQWITEAGRIDLMIGSSSADIRLQGTINIQFEGRGEIPAAAIMSPVIVTQVATP